MIVLFLTFAATTLILNSSQRTFQSIQSGGQMWVEDIDEISVCTLLSEGRFNGGDSGVSISFLTANGGVRFTKKE